MTSNKIVIGKYRNLLNQLIGDIKMDKIIYSSSSTAYVVNIFSTETKE